MNVENELLDIVADVEATYHCNFEPEIVEFILKLSHRKCLINRMGNEYLPLLFKNELKDYVMRTKVNEIGGVMLCAKCVVPTRA